ncbi:GAF domain-containing protein [Labrys sp. ZIDIC5]|uniref:GAF domain-containing protein n=1 Tax=Labrys sedimenti TaxID=3106036 RepID=UPI002ACA8CE0|nr:GAF domain-containing protein [Labrys sp. ZIDIC5]MDZ5454589.1 GAF domain-containing protein [Labrys sp. ZIDIC5]
MHRFILRENAAHFRKLLMTEPDGDRRQMLQTMLTNVETELAELEEASARAHAVHDAHIASFMDTLLRRAVEDSRADFGNIRLYEPEHNCLLFAAQLNFHKPFLDHFAAVRIGDGSPCGLAFERRSAVWIEDVNGEPVLQPHLEIMQETGFRALQSIPLTTAGRVFGVVSSFFRSPRRWDEQERQERENHVHGMCNLIVAKLGLADLDGAPALR